MNAIVGQHSQISSDQDISHLFLHDEAKRNIANSIKSDWSTVTQVFSFLGCPSGVPTVSIAHYWSYPASLDLTASITVVNITLDTDPECQYTPISHLD